MMHQELRDEEDGAGVAPAMSMPTTQVETSDEGKRLTSAPERVPVVSLLFVIMVASFVEMIAAARVCDLRDECSKERAWAVICGAASTIICFIFILYFRIKGVKQPALAKWLSIFFLAWWTLGAGVTTFREPFTETGNGYFAAWMAYLTSLNFAYNHFDRFRNLVQHAREAGSKRDKNEIAILLLFIASGIEMIEASSFCDKFETCTGRAGWAVGVGVISLVFSGIHIIPVVSAAVRPSRPFFAVLLALMWIPGAGILTFGFPFTSTGNGYFSCWVALFAAFFWVAGEVPELIELKETYRKSRLPEPKV